MDDFFNIVVLYSRYFAIPFEFDFANFILSAHILGRPSSDPAYSHEMQFGGRHSMKKLHQYQPLERGRFQLRESGVDGCVEGNARAQRITLGAIRARHRA